MPHPDCCGVRFILFIYLIFDVVFFVSRLNISVTCFFLSFSFCVVNVVIQTYIKISTQDAFLEKIFPGTLKSKIFESQII